VGRRAAGWRVVELAPAAPSGAGHGFQISRSVEESSLMRFTETRLAGAFIVELEPVSDSRGFFARTFCAREFVAHGLSPTFVQCNLSVNARKGTLRGLHYQASPATETKLIRCTRGALYYVLVDMRSGSATYLQHVAVEISAENRMALYVPGMVAVGYQALTDGAEAMYQVGEFYTPAAERGLRHDDPSLDISWPLPVTELSRKDASWPLLSLTPAGANR